MTGPRALTLHQPWASLVALLVKRIETRSWSTKYRGRLYIHAGLTRPRSMFLGDYLVTGTGRLSVKRTGHGTMPLPLGAIVASCELVDVVPILGADERLPTAWMPHVAETRNDGCLWFWKGPGPTEVLSTGRPPWLHDDITDQRPYGDFTPGRYAWILDDIQPVDPPVPCRGRQGLWTPPEGLLSA